MVYSKNGAASAAPAVPAGDLPASATPSHPHEAEFTAFCRREYRGLLGPATLYAKSAHDADDALNKAMFELYENWPLVRSPRPWVRRRTIWNIHKIWRARGDERFVPMPDADADCFAYEPHDELAEQEWIEQLLAVLPPAQRAVLRLYLEGLSTEEIAAELRKTQAAIRQNYKLGRDRLRPEVAEYDRATQHASDDQATGKENQ